MGLIDQKKSVFTTIGSYTAMMQAAKMPDNTNLFPSINNGKDIIPYMLDILKTIAGTEALKKLTGELLTSFVDTVEPPMKVALKKQLTSYNSGYEIPDSFKNGYEMPVKKIDFYGKFKTSPDSASGQVLYDTGIKNFDTDLGYNSILNAGTETNFSVLSGTYNPTTDGISFKPNLGGTTPNIGGFMEKFIDDAVIIDKKSFVTNTVNSIYGTVSKNQGKSVEEVIQELEINKYLDMLINDDDSFEISPDDYDALLRRAQEIVDGVVYYDMGCGILSASLPMDKFTDLIANISGSTDPHYVGNQLNDTIDESIQDKEAASQNKETIKDGFFKEIIKMITLTLAAALTTVPQIQAIMAITVAIMNNGLVLFDKIKDIMKNLKVFLKCIINEAMRLINEFIFNTVKVYLIALITPIISRVIREKINQFIRIMKSLVSPKIPINTS